MGEVKKEELVNVLSNTLPTLSHYINRIVTLLPKDVNDIDNGKYKYYTANSKRNVNLYKEYASKG